MNLLKIRPNGATTRKAITFIALASAVMNLIALRAPTADASTSSLPAAPPAQITICNERLADGADTRPAETTSFTDGQVATQRSATAEIISTHDVKQRLIPLARGKGANRSRVSYEQFKRLVMNRWPHATSLSPREEKLIALWYWIVQPEMLNFELENTYEKRKGTKTPREEKRATSNRELLESPAMNLQNALMKIHEELEQTDLQPKDLQIIEEMALSTFGFLATKNDADKKLLISRFFNGSVIKTWDIYVNDTDKFLLDLHQLVESFDLYNIPEVGAQVAAELANEPQFKVLEKLDPEFADHVIWLKKRTTDFDQFKFAFGSLLSQINVHYRRLLAATAKMNLQVPPEFQNIMRGLLLRKAYQTTLEQMVNQLRLKTINLDEVYGTGRIDGHVFAEELFTNGYIFWDRSLSSMKKMNSLHGSDFHVLQTVLYGTQMDHELGAGTFSKFYRKMGRPERIDRELPHLMRADERLFYHYGWLNLFDDVITQQRGIHYASARSISRVVTLMMQQLFPLIVD